MDITFPHVVRACRQALDAHETFQLTYTDALRTAGALYIDQWSEHRKRTRKFGPAEAERLRKYPFPTAAANQLFQTNLHVYSVLASKDPLLAEADIFVRELIDTESTPRPDQIFTFRILLYAYNDHMTGKDGGAPWRVKLTLGGQRSRTFVLCSRRAWAVFVALRPLWASLPCAPKFDTENEMYGYKNCSARSNNRNSTQRVAVAVAVAEDGD
jgi:hypothetical protein